MLFFHRVLAEIPGTIEKGNFEHEKDLSCEFLAVTKIHIDMGKKKANPVTFMLFFDKEGRKVEPMTEEELSHLAPGRVDYDKLLILLRLETFLLSVFINNLNSLSPGNRTLLLIWKRRQGRRSRA